MATTPIDRRAQQLPTQFTEPPSLARAHDALLRAKANLDAYAAQMGVKLPPLKEAAR